MKKSVLRLFSLSLALLLSIQLAFAKPTRMGRELEATNARLYDRASGYIPWSRDLERAQFRLINRIAELCPQCKLRSEWNRYGYERYRITFPQLGGYWVNIDLDPGVVEIQDKPVTLEEYLAIAPELQHLVFDPANELGLSMAYKESAMHVHQSAEDAFEGNPVRFRNYIVDRANHPELASGALEFDWTNAPPLAALPIEAQQKFAAIIEQFDREGSWSIAKLARKIYSDVYSVTWDETCDPTQKYQAECIIRMAESGWKKGERTAETRSIHGQPNAAAVARVLTLLQMRLDYVEGLTERGVRTAFKGPFLKKLKKAEVEEAFQGFVTEMGGDWETFKFAMPKYASKLKGVEFDPAKAVAPQGAATRKASWTADSIAALMANAPTLAAEEANAYYGGKIHPAPISDRHFTAEQLAAFAQRSNKRAAKFELSDCAEALSAKGGA